MANLEQRLRDLENVIGQDKKKLVWRIYINHLVHFWTLPFEISVGYLYLKLIFSLDNCFIIFQSFLTSNTDGKSINVSTDFCRFIKKKSYLESFYL